MDRYSVFMDRKTQYHKDVQSSQSTAIIKPPTGFLVEVVKLILKFGRAMGQELLR